MPSKPEKVVVIGLDAPIPNRVYQYAMRGDLPNIKALITKGAYAENCLVPHPTITPPNWTTIVTGAWIGTHGITCFNMHKPGMPLNETYPAFDSRDCKAEYIWEALERDGKRSILLNYPSTWPPRGEKIVQIGGAGLAINEWRVDIPEGTRIACSLSTNILFSTEDYPMAYKIELRESEGWNNLPGNIVRSLEAELNVDFPASKFRVEPVRWWLLVADYGSGFNEVIISETKDYGKAFARLREGEWSNKILSNFKTENGTYKAVFKFKLLELSADASKLKLYLTPICALHGNSKPDGIVEKIDSKNGLPMPSHGVFRALNLGWIDENTFLELIDMEHEWLADAASWLMRNYDWSFFAMHVHCPDWAYHAFSNKIDPSTAENAETAELYGRVELEFYKSIDRMIGRICKAAGEDALIVITSDHGAKPTGRRFDPRIVLENAGLLVYKEANGERVVDWKRTKAIPQRSCYIYVNLRGRDPEGSVPPEEYNKVQDEIIKALYDYTDPETGIKPVIFALKKEDARVIGLYGDRIGDVIFALRGEFGGQHGPHLTTVSYGIGSLKGLLIMAGPGIKEGFTIKRTVWLTDIIPTVCYLAEFPIPRDAEGSIIYQALKDPDTKLKELRTLRRNYRRVLEALEKERSLEHTYYMS
ncbi:hypothetical protein CW702_02465 [Candidatus Bathyarchaeota archaeon]|nr:MAG: hypothetical protein CW702_02465 [Candidatus Bathyarchaeota archaeon]